MDRHLHVLRLAEHVQQQTQYCGYILGSIKHKVRQQDTLVAVATYVQQWAQQ